MRNNVINFYELIVRENISCQKSAIKLKEEGLESKVEKDGEVTL